MKNYGLATIYEFLGDRVVYRNLAPLDPALPALADLRASIGLPPGAIPRKTDPEYARVVVHMLAAARRQDAPGVPLERLVFVGDTRLLDGTAFVNLCAAGGWPGLAFIGSETKAEPAVEVIPAGDGQSLYLSNRWAALPEFDAHCRAQGLPVDERAAVIIDLDKTALGARGRNGHVIDQARLQAVQDTLAGLLGTAFDMETFRLAYEPLNQPEFHPFTGDNQDYLAYICLILGAGLYSRETLMAQVRAGQMTSFAQFIAAVETDRLLLPPELLDIHAEIYLNVQKGDPTPFKAFRRTEYLATVRRFGCADDNTPLDKLLSEEIVITQEVRRIALAWRGRGALLFGLSDKPDEAALPTLELAAQGYPPLHRARTHAIGE
jgi:hypothetical protein